MFTGSTKMYLSAIVQMLIGNEEKKQGTVEAGRYAGQEVALNSSVLAI